ncbi:hypothetical protein T11_15977 [Trichinella zimbabwensis]|uniref:Uncharacterized protein n=1 Tax=Trichinella zimbabwensis TaxID=268475 RepID=A0A0V1GYN3_9BILA|nr:hypothetical protein T11_15977 [Trichinella zimbabwensis]
MARNVDNIMGKGKESTISKLISLRFVLCFTTTGNVDVEVALRSVICVTVQLADDDCSIPETVKEEEEKRN